MSQVKVESCDNLVETLSEKPEECVFKPQNPFDYDDELSRKFERLLYDDVKQEKISLHPCLLTQSESNGAFTSTSTASLQPNTSLELVGGDTSVLDPELGRHKRLSYYESVDRQTEELSNSLYNFPDIAAQLDESPWVWGKIDTSPLKLSDMQLSTATPESIRRQRRLYRKFSSTLQKQDDANTLNNSAGQANTTNSQQSSKSDSAHLRAIYSYKKGKRNSMSSPELKKDVTLNTRESSFNEEEKREFEGKDDSVNETSVKNQSLSNSNKSFNSLFNIGMLQNISDESISLTYTHTEQLSSEASDFNESIHKGNCVKNTENLRLEKSVLLTSHSKKNVSLECSRQSNLSNKETEKHELSHFTTTPKPESSKSDLQRSCLAQEKAHGVGLSRYSGLNKSSAFNKELSPFKTDHENEQGLLKKTQSHWDDRKMDYLPNDSISVSIEASNMTSKASETKLNHCAENLEKTFASTDSEQIKRVNSSLSEEGSKCQSHVFLEKNSDDSVKTGSNSLFSQENPSLRLSCEVAKWRRLCQETMACAYRYKPKVLNENFSKSQETTISSGNTSSCKNSGFSVQKPINRWRSCGKTELFYPFDSTPRESCSSSNFINDPKDISSNIPSQVTVSGDFVSHSHSQENTQTSNTLDLILSEQSNGSSTTYQRLMGQVNSGVTPRSFFVNPSVCTSAVTTSTGQSMSSTPYFMLNSVCTPVTAKSEERLPPLAPRYTSNISGASSGLSNTIPTSSVSNSDYFKTSLKGHNNNVGHVFEKYNNVKGFVNPDNYYHPSSSIDTVYSSSVCLSNLPQLTSHMFSANSNTATNETSATHSSFYFSAPSTNSSSNTMIQQSTKTSSSRTLGTDSSTLSNAILLSNIKETPAAKGKKEYGRCCFFQGPTPATSDNQRIVRKITERPSRESYEFNQEASTLYGIPVMTCSREVKELREVLNVKETEDEEGLFITPYPVRQTEERVVQELTKNTSSRHVRFDAEVGVQLNVSSRTQRDTLSKEKAEEFLTCKTISRRLAVKHWLSRKDLMSRKHRSLCLKRIRLINQVDRYGTAGGKKELITIFSSKHSQKSKRWFARKRLSCGIIPKVLENDAIKTSANTNALLNNFEKRDEHKNKCLREFKPSVNVSEPELTELPFLWLELNQKIRDYGLSASGIPALEQGICTVYTDLLLKSPKTKKMNYPSLKNRTSDSVKDSLVTNEKALKTCKKPKTTYTKMKLGTLSHHKNSLKNVSDRSFNVEDDAVSQLVANVDIVKVLHLWNGTLNELIKYKQYCSELCNLEGPHLRVFQKNDALQKENCALKEKVDILERHLRQRGALESERWDSQIDNYSIMVENERLKKLVNEEKEKLKIVLFQKRQQDMTVNLLKSKIKRFIEKENRIRIKAKETITCIIRRLPAIRSLKEISEKPFFEGKKYYNKILMRERLFGTKKGDFIERGMTTLRNALCEDNVIPSGISKATNSNRFISLKSNLSQDGSVADLVWFYEEQIDGIEREKEELCKRLMNATKLLKRQYRKKDVLQMDKETKKFDRSGFKNSLTDYEESKRIVCGPSEGKFLETMATTATIHEGETFYKKEEALPTAHVAEFVNKQENKVCLQESTKPLNSSSRWIVDALQTQLQKTIEEKTKKELFYENEIKALKKNQTQNDVNNTCGEEETFFNEVTDTERCCDILLKNKYQPSSTKLLMQRDKQLFQKGLHNRLLKLQEAGALLPIVDACCRAMKLEDPQKLAEIVQKLVAATQEAVEQKGFVDSVANTLGVSYLNGQRRYEDIQKILLQWRRVLANADTLISIRRLTIQFLNLIQNSNTKSINQVDVLHSSLNEQKSKMYSSDDGELIRVLSCLCDTLKGKINSEKSSQECNTAERESKLPKDRETKQSKDRETHSVQELSHFMNLFKVPSVDLCKTAMDRLHLKITEHIRFYRSLLKVLGLDSSLSPLQVIEEVSLIKHAKSVKNNKDTNAFVSTVTSLSAGMVSDELRNFLKVFRAIQIRLNLPNLPPGSLNKILVSIGDEEPYEKHSVQKRTSLLDRDLVQPDEYEESVNGLLSCSSLSSSSVISLSCDNLQNTTKWKNWAQVTFFTIDLMARIVEQFRFASKKKLKHSENVCSETNQT